MKTATIGFGWAWLIVLVMGFTEPCGAAGWNVSTMKFNTPGTDSFLSNSPARAGNTIIAAWQDVAVTPQRILYGKSTNGGNSWTVGTIYQAQPVSTPNSNPAIATDGMGRWLTVWQAKHDGTTVTQDYEILVSSSTDGTNWSAPVAVNSNAGTDTGDDVTPAITMNAAGRCVITWKSDNAIISNQTVKAIYQSLWYSYSDDGGVNWEPAAPLYSESDQSASDPALTLDTLGGTGLTFASTSTDYSSCTLHFSRISSGTVNWSTPILVSSLPATSFTHYWELPALISAEQNRWITAWCETSDTKVSYRMARSMDDGLNWNDITSPTLSSYQSNAHIKPTFSRGSANSIIMGSPAPILTNDAGSNWSNLPTNSSNINFGNASAFPLRYIWADSEQSYRAIYNPRVTNELVGIGYTYGANEIWSGRLDYEPPPPLRTDWSVPQPLSAGANPKLVHNGKNQWLCLFSQIPDGQTDLDIFYSYSVNGSAWSDPQPLNSDWQSDSQDDHSYSVSGNPTGIWIATWNKGTNQVWIARSLNFAYEWEPSSQLILNGSISAFIGSPSIAYFGLDSLNEERWLLCAVADNIYVCSSNDNGLNWDPSPVPRLLQAGTCCNTSPCSTHAFLEPVIHAGCELPFNTGKPRAHLGFNYFTSDRSYGSMNPTYSQWESSASSLEGTYFPGLGPLSFYGQRPSLNPGSQEGATDRLNNWIWAYDLIPNSVTFSTTESIKISTRDDFKPSVALDRFGTYYGFWLGRQALDITTVKTFLMMISPGHNPGRLDTTNADAFGTITNQDSASDTYGRFVNIFETKDSTGNSKLWYSYAGTSNIPSSAADWQLFE